jgi:hypothetical protein
MSRVRTIPFALIVSFVAVCAAGCKPGPGSPPHDDASYTTYLYMTDTYSGKVYTFDPESHVASPTSIGATAQNSTGEILFHKGIAYVCVGDWDNDAPGLYRFDPSDANPAPSRIGTDIDAQFVAFAGDSKGYLCTFGNGLHSFDPSSSNPSFTLVSGTGGMSLQEAIVGSDGYVYAADNANGAVIRIDPSDDSIEATVSTSARGTTGLVAGTYGGAAGVFVANTGGYESAPPYAQLPGSIEFIANGATTGTIATVVADALSGGGSIYPKRLVQLSDGDLLATGDSNTYRIDLSGASPAVYELTISGSSFGSGDIAYKDGLVYIPSSGWGTSANHLYVLGEDGVEETYSPVLVMETGDGFNSIAFYED